jgi:hypothetical protein
MPLYPNKGYEIRIGEARQAQHGAKAVKETQAEPYHLSQLWLAYAILTAHISRHPPTLPELIASAIDFTMLSLETQEE